MASCTSASSATPARATLAITRSCTILARARGARMSYSLGRSSATTGISERALPLQEGRVHERGVLAPRGIRDRLLQALRPFPLGRRPRTPLGADLVEAPIDLEPVPVGISELDRDLATCAPPALEIDRNLLRAKEIAGAQHLVERAHLEGHVVEFLVVRLARHDPDERHAVMIGIAAHEHHAAGTHASGINIRHLKAQDLRVEAYGASHVADVEDDVADLVDAERQALRTLQLLHFLRIECHGRLPRAVLREGS